MPFAELRAFNRCVTASNAKLFASYSSTPRLRGSLHPRGASGVLIPRVTAREKPNYWRPAIQHRGFVEVCTLAALRVCSAGRTQHWLRS